MDLFSLSNEPPRPKSGASRQVKDWFRELLALDDSATITVTELRCAEEDCPDVETVVGLLLGPGRQWKWRFLSPSAGLTRELVGAKLAEFPFDPKTSNPNP